MAVAALSTRQLNFVLLQCLGWGTLFSINIYLMWLSGKASWGFSLTISVFLVMAVLCSFILRSLLKPVAPHAKLLKLTCMTILYSFIAGAVTVQSGFILLAILPDYFGGQASLDMNFF